MERDVFGNRNVSLVPASRPAGLSSWLEVRENNRQMQRTVSETGYEQGRAILTKSAMENVAVLSALEANLYQAAPGGANRYRLLIDAYTVSAAQRITRY